MKIIKTEKLRIPIFNWCPDIEDGALEQAENLANLPFAFKHIAIMPDSHQGYGMPIGGVMATKGVIVPNAVGVDIGCGLCAVKTSLEKINTKTLKEIMGAIRKVVPVEFNKHKEKQDITLMPKTGKNSYENTFNLPIIYREFLNARKSLGTLGGGNHFIEIQKGDDGYIWIMIHSGSRNLGYTVANHYNNVAIKFNEKQNNPIPKKWELAFLLLDSKEGRAYLKEMNYCVDYALANRKLMMDRVIEIFKDVVGQEEISLKETSVIKFDEMINIAHNYARMENHFGQNVMVHRKGATLATKDTIGIIPGSQGSASYIIKGKGNPESFNSCSHGAGRIMGRKQAQRELDLKKEIKKLDDMGVIHAIREKKDLDEAPGSYKPIDDVMNNQKDLAKILVCLKPLAVIKG